MVALSLSTASLRPGLQAGQALVFSHSPAAAGRGMGASSSACTPQTGHAPPMPLRRGFAASRLPNLFPWPKVSEKSGEQLLWIAASLPECPRKSRTSAFTEVFSRNAASRAHCSRSLSIDRVRLVMVPCHSESVEHRQRPQRQTEAKRHGCDGRLMTPLLPRDLLETSAVAGSDVEVVDADGGAAALQRGANLPVVDGCLGA